MQKHKTSLIILAGGKNTRYNGINKAFIKYKKIAFFDRILMNLRGLFTEIIVVTNKKSDYSTYPEVITTEDILPNRGPLGGIHSGLQKISNKSAFIVSCDTPLIERVYTSDILTQFQAENFDACVPMLNNRYEPLFAIYKKELWKEIESYLQNGDSYSIQRFLRNVKVQDYTATNEKAFAHSLSNINSEEELNKLND